MVAFNFKECFADEVECGIKRGSIRSNKKCNVGDAIQLYTGQRTKACRKLGEAICIGVVPIRITDDCPWSMDMDNKEGEILYDCENQPIETHLSACEDLPVNESETWKPYGQLF